MKRSVLVISLLLGACSSDENVQYDVLAEELAQRLLIVDTHLDVPYRIDEAKRESGEIDVGASTADGDFDYPRAKSGGLNTPFMSIYVPAETEQGGTSREVALSLISHVETMVEQHPDKFAIPYSVDEMMQQVADGLLSLPLGMENGAPLEGDLNNLRYFAQRGVRYITLTHAKSNHISDSSYDENRQWKGLSEFGKNLIPAMNREGVMVDVSHISDEAFWQVMEISRVPVIASHSSARSFTPGFERNMSDEMIVALADQGGLIMINFGSTFVSQKSRVSYDAIKLAVEEYAQENSLAQDSEQLNAYRDRIFKERFVYADINDVLDHFDHVRDLVGINHLGIGSDFDGVGDSLPAGLKSVVDYPNLIAGLLERDYSEVEIEKILGGNLLRVWREVEAFAETPGEIVTDDV
ncbi:dipeptidase [Microbulbifer salipaludis]|uniref:Dipeptidase n=1 Tax=Microbulbifer salipaludis TaxID=187980 RepID=A0ABS3E2K6_9GAMM|nr:dipeptidase [Microbulbifer salipaludis]MBN8429505.1 dipeptidase [Microbulbifer salipaludis]